jgi:hypothetical protein
MAKAATTKQQGRTMANKTKVSQKSGAQMAKGPTKKGTNNQKHPASDGSDDRGHLEKEPKEPHAQSRKKARHVTEEEVDGEENEEGLELVVKADSDTEAKQVEQVSS